MKNLNPIKKKISKQDGKLSARDSAKLLAQFFNGFLIEIYEDNT